MLKTGRLAAAVACFWLLPGMARAGEVCERTITNNTIIIMGDVTNSHVAQQSRPALTPDDLRHLCEWLGDRPAGPGKAAKQASAEHQTKDAELAHKLAVTERMLDAALRIAQEAGPIDEEMLARRFVHAMRRGADMKAGFETDATNDATVAELLREGSQALREGELNRAAAIAAQLRLARSGLATLPPNHGSPTIPADCDRPHRGGRPRCRTSASASARWQIRYASTRPWSSETSMARRSISAAMLRR